MATDSKLETLDILLVEPNPGDTRLFTEKLKEGKLANTLHSVEDGDAALDFVYQRGEYTDVPRPDLILLELQLPGKPGMEVLSELNNDPKVSEIAVAALTSSELGEDLVRSHGLEADHYLQKPVEPDEFVEFVRSIEDFWLAFVQNPHE
ncbi:response regulator [Haloprofundus salilacus]|uniref:response regulator n=1 Tax=Haloprofundus salilacus TaxID=2876190 RepID=UPI001CCCB89B|nr:response regulator [Haloprofundus salilacus]